MRFPIYSKFIENTPHLYFNLLLLNRNLPYKLLKYNKPFHNNISCHEILQKLSIHTYNTWLYVEPFMKPKSCTSCQICGIKIGTRKGVPETVVCSVCECSFHISCTVLGRDELTRIDKYHCEFCAKNHGPSTCMKIVMKLMKLICRCSQKWSLT